MGETKDPASPEVKVGYLELNESEKKLADAVMEQTKSFLVQGFRDQIAAEREKWEKETDPKTRPTFGGPASPTDTIDKTGRFQRLQRAVVDKSSGKTTGWRDSATSDDLHAGQALGESRGGWLPPVQMSPDERAQFGADFATFVDDLADAKTKDGTPYNVLKFPRGEIENFSVARWAMALERSQNTSEGTLAFSKHAPWESAYYAALEAYATTKAQGDMTSGQDGGFLAPELWSTSFELRAAA
jgi:hypothetical protein